MLSSFSGVDEDETVESVEEEDNFVWGRLRRRWETEEDERAEVEEGVERWASSASEGRSRIEGTGFKLFCSGYEPSETGRKSYS